MEASFLSLVRRDKALRANPRWLILSVLTGTMILGFITYGVSQKEPVAEGLYLAMAWIVLSLFFLFGNSSARGGALDQTLPIPAPRLWLAHLIALFVNGFTILLAVAVVVGLMLWVLVEISKGEVVPISFSPSFYAQLVASLVLAIVALQSRRPSLGDPDGEGGARRDSIVILILILALAMFLLTQPVITALIPLCLALLLGFRSYRAVPSSFLVHGDPVAGAAPSSPSSIAASRSAGVGETHGLSYFAFLLLTVYRSIIKNLTKGLVILPFLFIFGMILADGLDNPGFHEIRYTLILITAYMFVSGLGATVPQVHQLDAQPLSRRLIFTVMILPGLLTLWAGYGIGRITARDSVERRDLIEIREHVGIYSIKVPIEACEIAWDGKVPLNVSPWGEVHSAWSSPVYEGSKAQLYSPYSTVMDCSPEFFVWQLARAFEAVYGERIPPNEIKERYLEIEGGEWVVPKEMGEPLAASQAGMTRQSSGPVFPLMMLVIAAIWAIPAIVYLRSYRVMVSERRRKTVYLGILAVMIVLHMGQYLLFMKQITAPYLIRGFIEIAVRNLNAALPGGSFTIYALCLLGMAGIYTLVERQFSKIEVMKGMGCTPW